MTSILEIAFKSRTENSDSKSCETAWLNPLSWLCDDEGPMPGSSLFIIIRFARARFARALGSQCCVGTHAHDIKEIAGAGGILSFEAAR